MTLYFPYQLAPLVSAAATSKPSRMRPYAPIRIVGPVGARRFSRALIDTGADDSIFPISAAKMIGVTQFIAPSQATRSAIKWQGQSYPVDFAKVELELSDGAITLRFAAQVGFSPAPIATPLLGQIGFFEFLDVKFIGADQMVEIEPNSRTFFGQTF